MPKPTPKPKTKKSKPAPKSAKRAKPAKPAADQIPSVPPDTDAQILASTLTLHELFQQQTTAMLDRADLTDEQKQSLLIAMSCPCCGAGGFSFTAKLRR